MIIAPAIKTPDGRVFISRSCHAEIMMMHPDEFKSAEQGFVTDMMEFKNRTEALIIAKKYNQIKVKYGLETELYSEDLFMEMPN